MPSMTRFPAYLLIPALFLMVQGVGHAHGGTYRGPGFGGSPGFGPGGGAPGTTPPPGTVGRPTPSRAPRNSTPDVRLWETWWGLNREEFLPSRGLRRDGVVIDGYENRDKRIPSRAEVRDLILPVLKKLLAEEKSQDIRDSAALALGRVGGESELPILKSLLDDRQGAVREAAILGLGLMRESAAEDLLATVVFDTSRLGRERGLALTALGLSGGDRARTVLTKELGKESELYSKSSRGQHLESLRTLCAMLSYRQDLVASHAPQEPHPAVGHIIDAIRRDEIKDDLFVPVGFAALAKSRDPAAGPLVMKGLRHRKSVIRAGAAIAAGRVFRNPDLTTVKQFHSVLRQESEPLSQRLLVISLGRMGGPHARDLLLHHYKSADRQESAFVLLALGLTGDPSVLPVLRKALTKSRDQSTKGAACIALGIIGDRESTDAILELIKRDRNPLVRSHAVQALTVMGEVRALPIIAQLLGSEGSPDIQASCAEALGLLGSVEHIPLLIQQLRGKSSSSGLMWRSAIANGMGRMGDRAVISPLLELAQNHRSHDLLRAFAISALGIVGEKDQTRPPFSRTTIDTHYGVTIEALLELRSLL